MNTLEYFKSMRLISKSFKVSSFSVKVDSPQICSKLTVLGGGKMAEAILNALSSKKIHCMSKVSVYDINKGRLEYLKKKYNVEVCNNAQDAVKNAEIVILAVKPQNIIEISQSIPPISSGLLISIVAGCPIDKLKKNFGTNKIVRSMPNTPAMVLEGITVWTATPDTPGDLVEKARLLIGCIGEEIEVFDEKLLDMATAVSGSGPAYVFLTMEAMVDAAVHIGFPRDVALKLVLSTIKGSASYAMQSEESLSTLKNNVTSPGGTTASALYELEKGGFRTVVSDAIWSAYRRALELGDKNPNVGPGRNSFKSN